MSYLEISNPWGIADKELGASLTWSTTLIKSSKDALWWNKIIIDFWMHQWGKNADLLNKEIPKELIDADFLVITHAHMDHIWRIPQLVKARFKWKIIMTAITKDIALLMWQDYINLTQKQIEEFKEWNKKKWQRFREYLKFITIYDKLKQNNLNKKEREFYKKILIWLYKWNDIDWEYLRLKSILNENKIYNQDDIESVLNSNIPELLYDINDVYKTLNLIETLEVWEEISLDSRIVITKSDSDVIEKIPEIIEGWYNKPIYVLPNLKRFIIAKWEKEYNETKKSNEELKRIKEKYDFLIKELKKLKKYETKKSSLYCYKEGESCDFDIQIKNKEKEINKKRKINIEGVIYDIDFLINFLENRKIYWKYVELFNNRIIYNEKTIDKKDVLKNVLFKKDEWLKKDEISNLSYYFFLEVLNWKEIVINSKYKSYFLKELRKFLKKINNNIWFILNNINFFKNFIDNTEKIDYKKLLSLKKEITSLAIEIKNLKDKKNKYDENKEYSYYIELKEKLRKNPIYILREELSKILSLRKEIEKFEEEYKEVDWETLDENKKALENIENKITEIEKFRIENLFFKDLLYFYENILKKFIQNKNKKNNYTFELFLNDFDFFENNLDILKTLFKNNQKNLKEFLKLRDRFKKLIEKKEQLSLKQKLILKKEEFDKRKKELDSLDKYWIFTESDIDKVIKNYFKITKLKYTKKQIQKASSRLKVILEKDNEKIVESLRLKFLKAGHIEGSVMVSLTYVIKEIKSKVNWILNYKFETFSGHKEIKKSFKNLLFSWDLWKLTQPNLSWKPDIPQFKYDYVQLESTYADREHPDKQKEFLRLLKILSRPWKKLIAAFSLQRTQEILTELLNNKLENKENIEKLKRLYKTKGKFSREYKALIKKEKLTKEEQNRKTELFWLLSWLEEELQNIQKSVFTWFIIQDSALAEKITKEFIKHYPDTYKILDPLFQKAIFWKEQIRVLRPWEYKNLYTKRRIADAEIIISAWGMMQWWAIINHIKELISDKNATIILTWYVAEWTLGRQLLDIEKQLIWAWKWEKFIEIDWEKYEVKCKIESIWGYSSHMWQWDLVNFWWKLINYSKNAILSLTHWDETRETLKGLINWVNAKLNVIIPKLWNRLKIKL